MTSYNGIFRILPMFSQFIWSFTKHNISCLVTAKKIKLLHSLVCLQCITGEFLLFLFVTVQLASLMPISRIWKEYWMQLSSSTRTTLAVWSWPTWFVLHFISFTGSWNIYWCAFQKLLHFHVQCNPFVYYFLNDCCFFFHFDWTVAVNFCHNY